MPRGLRGALFHKVRVQIGSDSQLRVPEQHRGFDQFDARRSQQGRG